MENNPVAPTDAPAPASVASTNSNEPAPASSPASGDTAVNQPAEPTPEQMAKYLGTTVEGLEKAKKFYENNGGFDKVFGERKKEISTPSAQQPAQPQAPAQQPQAQQPNPYGRLNPDVVEANMVKSYLAELAAKPEFANISTQLLDGTVMEEAHKALGIEPIRNGDVNREQLQYFADMYSKKFPPVPASAPQTNIPTASNEPSQFTGPITSQADALRVLQESMQMQQAGKGQHPKFEEAKTFLNAGFKSRNPGGKEFTPWVSKKNKA